MPRIAGSRTLIRQHGSHTCPTTAALGFCANSGVKIVHTRPVGEESWKQESEGSQVVPPMLEAGRRFHCREGQLPSPCPTVSSSALL